MRFFCVPSFFPRIHFQIHEAFAQLRDSDISVLQSGLLRIDRLSLFHRDDSFSFQADLRPRLHSLCDLT
jgi:hypothetical protein